MTKPTLVHKATGKPVQIGEIVTDFRGDKSYVTGWQEPHKPASSGFIYVSDVIGETTQHQGFYPSVFGCEFIGRTDRD